MVHRANEANKLTWNKRFFLTWVLQWHTNFSIDKKNTFFGWLSVNRYYPARLIKSRQKIKVKCQIIEIVYCLLHTSCKEMKYHSTVIILHINHTSTTIIKIPWLIKLHYGACCIKNCALCILILCILKRKLEKQTIISVMF